MRRVCFTIKSVFKTFCPPWKCKQFINIPLTADYNLNNIKKYELKPSSLDRVEITINKHIEPYIGYIQVQNIAPTDIQKLINNMVDKGYSYSTIKKVYNVINTVLKLALERDYIRKNPCIGIALPKQMQRSKSEIVFFSDDEIKVVMKYLNDFDFTRNRNDVVRGTEEEP